MDICVRLPGGSILPVTLSSSASVATLKSRIQLSAGVPVPMQQLSARGKVLKDEQRVADCTQEVTLAISVLPEFLLRLIIKETSGITFQVNVRGEDSVWAVKKKIEELRGIEAQNQRLYADKKLLEDHQTVSDVYRPGSFKWELLTYHDRYVTVTTSAGCSYQVAVAPNHRVCSIVNKLREFEGFECRDQTLRDGERHVTKEELIQDLSSCEIGNLKCEVFDFWIWAVSLSVPQQKLHLHPSDSILSAIVPLTSSSAWILFNGQVLDPETTPTTAHLPSGSIIEYGDLLVHIRSFNVEKFEFAILSHIYIDAIKRELVKRLGRNTFKLMHCGAELDGKRTFRDCGFVSEVTIELVEPNDNYLWVESNSDKVAVGITSSLKVSALLKQFALRTGHEETYHLRLYEGRKIEEKDYILWKNGGVLKLYEDPLTPITAVDIPGGCFTIALQDVTDFPDLLRQLQPRFKASGIETIESEPVHLQLCMEERRFIGFRFSDFSVSFLPYNPSDFIFTLKSQLRRNQEDMEFVHNETRLENEKHIGDYAIQETEYIDVCRGKELIVWIHDTNERLFVTLSAEVQTVSDLRVICNALASEPVKLFSNKLLLDEMQLVDVGITPGCCVHVIPHSFYNSEINMHWNSNKFIFLQFFNGIVAFLHFHSSITWKKFTDLIEVNIISSPFSLVLDNHLLTNRRFTRICSGSRVQVFTASEAVLFRFRGGVVSPVPITLTATLACARQTANIHSSVLLKSRNNESMPEGVLMYCKKFDGVVNCVYSGERLCSVTEIDGERQNALCLHLAYTDLTLRDLLTEIKAIECDASCTPRFYLWDISCQYDERFVNGSSYLILHPPNLLIRVTAYLQREFTLLLSESDTVGSLRRSIAFKLKSQLQSFRIVHNITFLTEDAVALHEIDFDTDNRVTLLPLNSPVLVLLGTSNKVLVVKADAVFAHLQSHGYALGEATLLWDDRVIQPEDPINDYSKSNIATVYAVKLGEKLIVVSPSQKTVVADSQISTALFQSKFGINIDKAHTLHCVGELLKSHSIASYRLQPHSTLFLQYYRKKCDSNLHLYANFYGHKLVHFEVPCSFSIANIASILESKILCISVRVVIDGKVAMGNCSLQQLGITNFQIIDVLTKNDVLVTIEHGNNQVSCPVSKLITVSKLKEVISGDVSVPIEAQLLFLNENLLDDEMELDSIAAGESILTLTLVIRQGMIVIHKVNNAIAVDVSTPLLTGLSLKNKIKQSSHLKLSRYRLFVNDRELADDESIATEALQNGQVLSLLSEKHIHLTVKSPLCEYSLYLNKSNQVLSIVKKLQKKVGLFHSRLKLTGELEVTGDDELKLIRSSGDPVIRFCQRSTIVSS